jgi:hypothetical protein
MADELTSEELQSGAPAPRLHEATETVDDRAAAPAGDLADDETVIPAAPVPTAEESSELGGSTEAFRAFVESPEPPSGRSAALLMATMAVGLVVIAVIFLLLLN